MPADADLIAKLDTLLAAIRAYPDPRRASAEWKQAFNLLKKTDAAPNHVANVIAMRGVPQLATLINELRPPAQAADTTPDAAANASPTHPPLPPVDDATCKAAMRAFRKRLKIMRLDDESRIDSRNPMTKGQASQITAITPPFAFPPAVWAELARRGDLRSAGRGFYELTDE